MRVYAPVTDYFEFLSRKREEEKQRKNEKLKERNYKANYKSYTDQRSKTISYEFH